MPRFAAPSEYAKALRTRGAAVLAQSSSGRYADREQWQRSATWLTAFALLFAIILIRPPTGATFLLCALEGVLAYLIIATLGHDATHGSLSRGRGVNRAIVFAVFAIAGISGSLWARRHIRTHHLFPNVAGTDIDADSTSLVRLTPHVRWRWWHRFQPIYAPFLYLLVLAHLTYYEDLLHLIKARRDAPRHFATWSATFEFAATKLIHVAFALVLPLAVIDAPPSTIVAGYVFASASASAMFVVINIGTHICDVAAFTDSRTDPAIAHDWATHQALTAVDWSPQSWLAIALTGGANSHAAHHLFPDAAHCHNAALSVVVSQCAREFGKPHHVLTFRGMMASHFNHLLILSRPGREFRAQLSRASLSAPPARESKPTV